MSLTERAAPIRLRNRFLVAFAIALGMAFIARNTIAQTIVRFHSPHVVRTPRATLDAGLTTQLDTAAKANPLETPRSVVMFALGQTAARLHFGLSHRTRLSFDASEREGNCVEYAELFATIVNRERGGLDVHAPLFVPHHPRLRILVSERLASDSREFFAEALGLTRATELETARLP